MSWCTSDNTTWWAMQKFHVTIFVWPFLLNHRTLHIESDPDHVHKSINTLAQDHESRRQITELGETSLSFVTVALSRLLQFMIKWWVTRQLCRKQPRTLSGPAAALPITHSGETKNSCKFRLLTKQNVKDTYTALCTCSCIGLAWRAFPSYPLKAWYLFAVSEKNALVRLGTM